nr:GreA/GreB family elongation factor [Amycolatopsis granulosa]
MDTRDSIDRSGTVWLTEEAHARLRGELGELRVADEASGDDQDRILQLRRRQARTRELEDLLRRAVVGRIPPDDGVAEPGMVLTVRFDGEEVTETFLLGVRDGAGSDDLEVFSPDSPLGRAVTGARQGESRTYTVPSGATVRVTLVAAVPYGRHLSQQG